MCIGIPMQVSSVAPGFAWCEGRGELRRVSTALTGEVVIGEWLLIFVDTAHECISPQRAQEVNATLDLMAALMTGTHADDLSTAAGFELPSSMSAAQVASLSGRSIDNAWDVNGCAPLFNQETQHER